jgi:hypothetical protein
MKRRVSFADSTPSANNQQVVRRADSWHAGDAGISMPSEASAHIELADHEKLALDAALKAREVKPSVRQKKMTIIDAIPESENAPSVLGSDGTLALDNQNSPVAWITTRITDLLQLPKK